MDSEQTLSCLQAGQINLRGYKSVYDYKQLRTGTLLKHKEKFCGAKLFMQNARTLVVTW